MDIEEDYVSYETAVLLKEKGFIGSGEIGCTCGFYSDTDYESGYGIITKSGKEVGLVFDDLDNKHLEYNEYLRPTINIVMKWLRETYNLHISVFVGTDKSYDADGKIVEEWSFWTYLIETTYGNIIYDAYAQFDPTEYQSYEEACEAGIKYCLENLI